MTHADLDAARAARAAARAEAGSESVEITFGGRKYELVPELPLAFIDYAAAGRLRLALGVLLADPDDLDEFMGNRPSQEDLIPIAELYGFDGLGEALASPASLRSTGKRSRPTSKRTTG